MLLQIERIGQRKMGRRAKNYYSPTTGKQYDGLHKRPGDNRWTITATGQTKRFDDELQAIAWFLEWERQNQKHNPVAITATGLVQLDAQPLANSPSYDPSTIRTIPKEILAAYFRDELYNNAQEWANLTGIQQLANFRDMPLPRASIKLTTLLDNYKAHADVTAMRKSVVESTWNKFVEVTGATTLRDLTTETVLKFKDQIIAGNYSPESVKGYFSRVTVVIGFGLERGLDPVEIRSALDKCQVLVPPKLNPTKNPTPITPEDFQKLLTAAKDNDFMTAVLLLSLNAAFHPSECLAVEWNEIDAAGTFCTNRNKTGLVRAAVLWPRTMEAIQKLPRKGTQLFVSATGVAHSVYSLRRMFIALRTKAEVSETVTFDWIRDGAATACVTAGVSTDCYKLVMGHSLSGDMDNYARRNPAMVKPACTAIEAAYFPK